MWVEYLKEKAKGSKKKVIMPEGDDARVIGAAKKIKELGIAEVTLVSEKNIDGIKILKNDSGRTNLAFAAKEVAGGRYDCIVAGATYTTRDVIITAMKNIGVDPEYSLVSSFFLMESGNRDIGENGALLFADAAVITDPDASKLAGIAYATAHNARKVFGWEPRVAMLSFSTKSSVRHELVSKVQEAVRKLTDKHPDFIFDGEMQLDTAIVPEVAMKKDPDGILKGRANILIFPDLNSGNIGYKIAQRLGGFRAVGPLLQGFNRPVSDLSRGCSLEDIVDVTAYTVVQVKEK